MQKNDRFSNKKIFSFLIKKDDPIVTFNLTKWLIKLLEKGAKKSHRKLSTEIIIRVGRSFKYDKNYHFIKPLIEFDLFCPDQSIENFKKITHVEAKKNFKKKTILFNQYFTKKEEFFLISQVFPKELWHALNTQAFEKNQSIDKVMCLRLAATFEEPGLFDFS